MVPLIPDTLLSFSRQLWCSAVISMCKLSCTSLWLLLRGCAACLGNRPGVYDVLWQHA